MAPAPPDFIGASTTAAGAVETDRGWQAGMQVRLVGFQNATMNGARGKLGKFSAKQGLWQVFLESENKAKAVKPSNLELLAGEQGPEIYRMVEEKRPAPVRTLTTPSQMKGLQTVAAVPVGLVFTPAPKTEEKAVVAVEQPLDPEAQTLKDEETMPPDEDADAYIELLRDAYVRQLRSDADWTEPPPFPRVNNKASFRPPIPEGLYPAAALNLQFQILQRSRQDQGWSGKGFLASPELRWMAAMTMRKGPYAFGKGKGKGKGWSPMGGMGMPMMPPSNMKGKGWRPQAPPGPTQETSTAQEGGASGAATPAAAAPPSGEASSAAAPASGGASTETK